MRLHASDKRYLMEIVMWSASIQNVAYGKLTTVTEVVLKEYVKWGYLQCNCAQVKLKWIECLMEVTSQSWHIFNDEALGTTGKLYTLPDTA